MRLHRIARLSGALAIVFTAGAASSMQSGETQTTTTGGQAGALTVQIENNRPGGNTVIVHVVPEIGVRQQLGEVAPGATGDFNYRASPGYYTLVAVGSGNDYTSQRFRIFANTTRIRWDMSTNRVVAS